MVGGSGRSPDGFVKMQVLGWFLDSALLISSQLILVYTLSSKALDKSFPNLAEHKTFLHGYIFVFLSEGVCSVCLHWNLVICIFDTHYKILPWPPAFGNCCSSKLVLLYPDCTLNPPGKI